MSTESSTQQRCPTCESPLPKLHPAVQSEGEVQPCGDPWHGGKTSTQQRPWAAVARFPEPFDPKLAVAHFAAMAYAHHLAYGAGIVTAPDAETVVDLTYRHFFPMTAALTAAASMDETRDWTSSLVRDAIADGSGVPETCWQWLTAAGIDPDEIEAAR